MKCHLFNKAAALCVAWAIFLNNSTTMGTMCYIKPLCVPHTGSMATLLLSWILSAIWQHYSVFTDTKKSLLQSHPPCAVYVENTCMIKKKLKKQNTLLQHVCIRAKASHCASDTLATDHLKQHSTPNTINTRE